MGPIYDEQGLEQGGVNSSDFYKIFGSEQLGTAQASKLGVSLGPIVVSGIGVFLAMPILSIHLKLHDALVGFPFPLQDD